MTNAISPRQATLLEVRNLIHDIESNEPDGDPFDQVASIDVTRTVTLLLAYGGPTTGIDFRFKGVRHFTDADYWTTAYSEHGDTTRLELTDNEAHTLANYYAGGIDVIAEYHTTEESQ